MLTDIGAVTTKDVENPKITYLMLPDTPKIKCDRTGRILSLRIYDADVRSNRIPNN